MAECKSPDAYLDVEIDIRLLHALERERDRVKAEQTKNKLLLASAYEEYKNQERHKEWKNANFWRKLTLRRALPEPAVFTAKEAIERVTTRDVFWLLCSELGCGRMSACRTDDYLQDYLYRLANVYSMVKGAKREGPTPRVLISVDIARNLNLNA